jgi:phosphate transport system substrate-binding protein
MKKFIIAALTLSMITSPALAARDTIRIVGSSTVYPFTTIVAEQFGKKTGAPTPIVESTGTGGGFKLFCAGTGHEYPDVTNASRAIKESETKDCEKNGVTPIEVPIGIDAIVVAKAKDGKHTDVTLDQLYRAVAMYVIVDGKFVKNPNTHWNNAEGVSIPMKILGPPPTSGTRDSFVELVMEKACKAAIKEAGLTVTEDEEKMYCRTVREDGVYVEAGENDNLIVQKILANPGSYGIFGYSFLEENLANLDGASIDGIAPIYENIQSGDYAISRPLFVYFKKEHLNMIPNLIEFMEEYKSDDAIGDEGYLTDKGLISVQ